MDCTRRVGAESVKKMVMLIFFLPAHKTRAVNSLYNKKPCKEEAMWDFNECKPYYSGKKASVHSFFFLDTLKAANKEGTCVKSPGLL